MQRLARLSLLALCSACGGAPSAPADKPAERPADAPAASAPEALKDRSQTALVTTRETIAGVEVAVDLPAGLKREANEKEQWVNWTVTDGNPFKEPSITLKVLDPMMAPKDLEAFVRSASPPTQDKPPLVTARQEALPEGGMIVVRERGDGQFLKVEALHRSGEAIVRCSFTQRTGTGKPKDGPIPNFAATRAWAEKICLSVKLG